MDQAIVMAVFVRMVVVVTMPIVRMSVVVTMVMSVVMTVTMVVLGVGVAACPVGMAGFEQGQQGRSPVFDRKGGGRPGGGQSQGRLFSR
jgi:hypothetical protein